MLERFTRAQVFTVHLLLSLLIFSVLAGVMYFDWFPGPFFANDGGWQGVRIVAAVDLVLGPSLTLMLFNPKKKKHRALLFDLLAIALVQGLALSWGVWTTYNQRTVAVVFGDGAFYSVSGGALTKANATRNFTQDVDVRALDRHHPSQLYAQPYPEAEFGDYLASLLNGEPELHLRPDRYTPLAEHWHEVLKHSLDVDRMAADTPALREALDRRGGMGEGLIFFALNLRFGDALIAFSEDTRELRDIIVYRVVN